MKLNTLPFLSLLMCLAAGLSAQDIPTLNWAELQKAKAWEATEYYKPEPPVVTPGYLTLPPSDAVVLFDGHDLEQWRKPSFGYGVNMEQISVMAQMMFDLNYNERSTAPWQIKDGQLIVVPGSGSIETTEMFGDVQLHIEWLAPVEVGKEGQQYSNSGVFSMGLYEVQILNNYENKTYVNGQASSVYKQYPPLVNASRPPGEWQSYDIVFIAPKFKSNGDLESPAYVTVLHNGLLTQHHVQLSGPTCYIGQPYYAPHPEQLPISLQDHGNKIRFRNIWVRRL